MAVNVTGGALEFDAVINMDDFEASINRIQQQLNGLTQAANNEATAIENVAAKATTAVGAYLSLNAAKGFITQMVEVRGQFEQLNVAFETMLDSKDKADQLMAQVVQLAATTPFTLQDVATGAKQLLAYGTAAEDITKTLKMLGDVASGVSAPIQDIVYLYGTLQTQGRAYTRDILQFTSRGIPILEQLAKQFGVTKGEVQNLVEAGKVGFPEVQKAFQDMTSQGGLFFNLMDKQSQTVTGQISNLQDAFSQMLNSLGQSNEGIIKGAIGGLSTLVQNYQSVIDILGVLVATYGAYKAAVMAQSAVVAVYSIETKGLAIAETLYATAASIAQKATALLNTTLLANPYAAVAAVLVGLSVAMYEMRDSTTAAEKATKALREEEAQATQQKQDLLSKTQDLLNIIQSETSTRLAQLNAFKELQQLYPGFLGAMDLQKFKTIAVTDAQLEFNKAIEQTDLANKEKEYASMVVQLEELRKAQQAATANNSPIAPNFGDTYKGSIDTLIEKMKLLKKGIDETKEAQIEANASPVELKAHYEGVLDSLKKQRDQLEASAQLSQQTGNSFLDWKNTIAQISLGDLNKQIQEITDKLNNLAKPAQTNKQQIDAATSLDALNAIRTKILDDYNKATDKVTRQQLAADLVHADQRKKILDIYGEENKAAKTQESLETKINAILNQRQSLLDKITGLQRDSQQSGMLKSDNEVDNVRQKYDDALKAIEEYNQKIADFNKKNGTKLKGIGIDDIDKLKAAENIEVANTIYKQDSANYLAALDDKKKAFDDFEKIQQQGNDEETAFAKKKYSEQIGDFNSYLDYLKSQQGDLKFKLSVEPNNVGLQQSLLAVNKAITAEQNKQAADNIAQQIKDYERLFQSTAAYNQKRKAIDTQYYKDVALLARQYSGQELTDRINALKQSRQTAIDAAKDEVFQKSELYQKLNVQIVEMSRSQVKSQVEAIQTVLAKGVDIPPALKQQLQSQLDGLQKSLHYSSNTNYVEQLKAQKKAAEDALASGELSTEEYKKQLALIERINNELKNQTVKTFQKISSDAGEISGAFSNLAAAIQPMNDGLADTLQTMADIGQVLSNAAGAAADFAQANIPGGIAKTIQAIAGVFTIGAKARESQRKAQEDLKAYQDSIIKGEISYNELLRGRERTIKNINNLTATQLQQQLQLLQIQKQQSLADEQRLLQLIQQQGQQVTGETTEKSGGFLGIGRKTKAVQQLAGLSTSDYDQLEKLFTEGKLDDSTSKWFQELKSVHDELDSIGESAQQVTDQLNQVLTGTTADDLANSIKDGFANGYDSARDFANNLQDLFKNAILSAFEANQIKPAMQKFYDELSAFNSDGLLDQNEIDQLTQVYNNTVDSLAKQYDQIKQIANMPGASDTANSLAGAIKGITEDTAELMAGQLGAQRLTMVSMLNVATQQLNEMVRISTNTAYLLSVDNRLRNLETIMSTTGVKIR